MLDMSKEIRINVRTTPQIKRDLEIAAELKGLTVSALVNSAVVKAIREEKEREPQAFVPKDIKIRKATIHLSDGIKSRKVNRK